MVGCCVIGMSGVCTVYGLCFSAEFCDFDVVCYLRSGPVMLIALSACMFQVVSMACLPVCEGLGYTAC
jgi:hypothetical protein